jgi:hypothetical protein
MAVGSNLAEHLDEDLNELGINGCEALVRVWLRGKKEEKKRNGGERGGLRMKGRRREMRGVGWVGHRWWVRVKEIEGGTCKNLIGFGGFVERERR